jgi:hypothetical protein
MLEELAAKSPNPLIWVLYYSKVNLAGSTEEIALEYASILAKARHKNSREGITGAVVVSQGRFAQTLEGLAAALHRRYERIKQDPRHRFVTMLKVAPATERIFGSWAMTLAGSASGARFH